MFLRAHKCFFRGRQPCTIVCRCKKCASARPPARILCATNHFSKSVWVSKFLGLFCSSSLSCILLFWACGFYKISIVAILYLNVLSPMDAERDLAHWMCDWTAELWCQFEFFGIFFFSSTESPAQSVKLNEFFWLIFRVRFSPSLHNLWFFWWQHHSPHRPPRSMAHFSPTRVLTNFVGRCVLF